jgi:hypothetical protein
LQPGPQALLGPTPVTEPFSHPGLAAPQLSKHSEPVVAEPGSAGILVNSHPHTHAGLFRTHRRTFFLILAGLLTLVAVAITLGVILRRSSEPEVDQPEVKEIIYDEPSETVVDQPEVKETINDETEVDLSGEASFWQRNMWPLVFSVIGVIIVIVVIVKNKNFSRPASETVTSKTDTIVKPRTKLFNSLKKQIDDLRQLLPKDEVHYHDDLMEVGRPYEDDMEIDAVVWPSKVGEKDLTGDVVLFNLYRLRDKPGEYGLVLITESERFGGPCTFTFNFTPRYDHKTHTYRDLKTFNCYWYIDLKTDIDKATLPFILDGLEQLSELFDELLRNPRSLTTGRK